MEFKIPTYLFTRLDMDIDSIIKLNYERKEIAKMKDIVSENDALYNSAMWNFERVKHDKEMINQNGDNLTIQYIIGGLENDREVENVMKMLLF